MALQVDEFDLAVIKDGCATSGWTDEDISLYLGIPRRQLAAVRRQHSGIDRAIRSGIAEYRATVEKALLKAAIGYASEDSVDEEFLDENGHVVKWRKMVKRTIKGPDVKACMHILTNRTPQDWSNRQEIAVDPPESPSADKTREELEEGLKRAGYTRIASYLDQLEEL